MSELMDPLAKDSRKAASAFWKGAHSFTFVSGMFSLGVGKQLLKSDYIVKSNLSS